MPHLWVTRGGKLFFFFNGFLYFLLVVFHEIRVTERQFCARKFAGSWGYSRVEEADVNKVTPNQTCGNKLWLLWRDVYVVLWEHRMAEPDLISLWRVNVMIIEKVLQRREGRLDLEGWVGFSWGSERAFLGRGRTKVNGLWEVFLLFCSKGPRAFTPSF